MKLRFWSALLIFISAYSPLSIILGIQDFDLTKNELKHPFLVYCLIAIGVISCIITWATVYFCKSSKPPVTILKVSNRSGELINYSIPYMISFFVMDLDNINILISFAFFMSVMFVLTLRTHNIFVNPLLALLKYNLYDVTYKTSGSSNKEYENFFLVKGERLCTGDKCRVVELSERLLLVTKVNPEV